MTAFERAEAQDGWHLACPNGCDCVEIVHPFTQVVICSECDALMAPAHLIEKSPGLWALTWRYRYEAAAIAIVVLFILLTLGWATA